MKYIELLSVASDIVVIISGAKTKKQQARARTRGFQLMCLQEAHWNLENIDEALTSVPNAEHTPSIKYHTASSNTK